jgi:hypothetical protein
LIHDSAPTQQQGEKPRMRRVERQALVLRSRRYALFQ